MTLLEFKKTFGLSKILSCKQTSIDTWERIEDAIALYVDGEISFEVARSSIRYEADTILEILDKQLYDYTFWCEVKKTLTDVKEEG